MSSLRSSRFLHSRLSQVISILGQISSQWCLDLSIVTTALHSLQSSSRELITCLTLELLLSWDFLINWEGFIGQGAVISVINILPPSLCTSCCGLFAEIHVVMQDSQKRWLAGEHGQSTGSLHKVEQIEQHRLSTTLSELRMVKKWSSYRFSGQVELTLILEWALPLVMLKFDRFLSIREIWSGYNLQSKVERLSVWFLEFSANFWHSRSTHLVSKNIK